MADKIENIFKALEKKLGDGIRKLPEAIGKDVVNFSLENFKDQGWQGNSFDAWPHRKNPNAWGKVDDPGRALLVKTGKLRRSIRIGAAGGRSVVGHAPAAKRLGMPL